MSSNSDADWKDRSPMVERNFRGTIRLEDEMCVKLFLLGYLSCTLPFIV